MSTEFKIEKLIPIWKKALLHRVGRERGIKVKEISEKTGLTPRSVRKLMSEIRQEGIDGYVLMSDIHGYYLTNNRKEIMIWEMKMSKTIRTMQMRLDAVIEQRIKINS